MIIMYHVLLVISHVLLQTNIVHDLRQILHIVMDKFLLQCSIANIYTHVCVHIYIYINSDIYSDTNECT